VRSQSATRIVVLCERAQELTPLIGKYAYVQVYMHLSICLCTVFDSYILVKCVECFVFLYLMKFLIFIFYTSLYYTTPQNTGTALRYTNTTPFYFFSTSSLPPLYLFSEEIDEVAPGLLDDVHFLAGVARNMDHLTRCGVQAAKVVVAIR
jgi:hypothetical protein